MHVLTLFFFTGVNSFECLYKDIDHAQFYNGVLVFTATGPLLFAGVMALYWFVLTRWFTILKCGTQIKKGSLCPKRNESIPTTVQTISGAKQKLTYSDADAFISSTVLLWFISLPSLLQIGSGALKCWKVGDELFVFIDLQQVCWTGDHLL